jgi:hypothetical protein
VIIVNLVTTRRWAPASARCRRWRRRRRRVEGGAERGGRWPARWRSRCRGSSSSCGGASPRRGAATASTTTRRARSRRRRAASSCSWRARIWGAACGSAAAARVSPFTACIGSPCLRHCVHGASIGGGKGGGGEEEEEEEREGIAPLGSSCAFVATIPQTGSGVSCQRPPANHRSCTHTTLPSREPSSHVHAAAAAEEGHRHRPHPAESTPSTQGSMAAAATAARRAHRTVVLPAWQGLGCVRTSGRVP